MFLGTIGSARGYKEEVVRYRHVLLVAAIVSSAGALLGAILLLRTPPHLFERLVPYLLLFATLLFAFAPLFIKPREGDTFHYTPGQLVAQFFSAVYGGYFGAGQGFVMLAILAFSGLPNLNAMNAIKNVLAIFINGVALIPFVLAGTIAWPQAIAMAIGAVIGGYFGSRVGRRVPGAIMRACVITLGAAMTMYFFIR